MRKERSLHLLLLFCSDRVPFLLALAHDLSHISSPHQHATKIQHSFIHTFHSHFDFVFTMSARTQFPSYPSMERQDLSQGQLGSFKFAPVDADRIHGGSRFLSDLARHYMSSHLKQAAQNPTVTPVARTNSTRARLKQADSEHRQTAPLPHVPTSPASESSFFNNHIRSDLIDSRLKYGPAVVRSAVNSNSPERKRETEHVQVDVSEAPVQLLLVRGETCN